MVVTNIKDIIGEATEYYKKRALEEKKPKSWCKSVSAFANGYGGNLPGICGRQSGEDLYLQLF